VVVRPFTGARSYEIQKGFCWHGRWVGEMPQGYPGIFMVTWRSGG
jgi:hypothetical protein